MKYFFEALPPESKKPLAVSIETKNLDMATRLFNAYLAGIRETSDVSYEIMSATAYKRRGVEYRELSL